MQNNIIYDEIANSVIARTEHINKLLSTCQINSNLAKEDSEEMFEKVLEINGSEIVLKQPFSGYHSLSSMSNFLNQLDMHGKSTEVPKKKLLTGRSESVTSLSSDDNNRDYTSELRTHLKDMREVLGSIENTSIERFNEDSCVSAVTTKNNQFMEVVFSLQRLAREMTNIASTDNLKPENFSFSSIDRELIKKLEALNRCLDDMQRLDSNKNPITNIEKKANVKLEYTAVINNILDSIEMNSI